VIPSNNFFNLLEESEGFSSKAYKCPAGIPTIGFGSTKHENGNSVKMTDTPITKEKAKELVIHHASQDIKSLARYVTKPLTQNQFDAVLDFVYNLGIGSLLISTLLVKINLNPNDETIRDEFLRWDKAKVGGVKKKLAGLTKRRKAEADLYEKA
jgi:lysozyme